MTPKTQLTSSKEGHWTSDENFLYASGISISVVFYDKSSISAQVLWTTVDKWWVLQPKIIQGQSKAETILPYTQ